MTEPAATDFDHPVVVLRAVRWGDMDAFGHVNNTIFFKWFEDARIATFMEIGVEADPPLGVAPILARTDCDFLAPVTFPATVEIGCRVPRVGNTSFVMEYAVRVVDGPLVARGSGVVVMVDYRTGQKVPVPDQVREGIASLAEVRTAHPARVPPAT